MALNVELHTDDLELTGGILKVDIYHAADSPADLARLTLEDELAQGMGLQKDQRVEVWLGIEETERVFTGRIASVGTEILIKDFMVDMLKTKVTKALRDVDFHESAGLLFRECGHSEVVLPEDPSPIKPSVIFHGWSAYDEARKLARAFGYSFLPYFDADGKGHFHPADDIDECPVFERGNNIVNLLKTGNIVEVKTVCMPSLFHSMEVIIDHPQVKSDVVLVKSVRHISEGGSLRTIFTFEDVTAS
ncbi:hypothetical protein [Brevibacillus centrosporus]|uniref:Uncharacterized protein n=1 Tax=Brevibacillus centrosporus TaxID=54910 RepID=A0A1I3LZC7_9BACL|nr:hypothetical protein [Brevibacillus centrosporus]SFI89855.1 hypothetical protein SAMN05518846_101467 [Brevibacillus centrosporus]